MRRTSTRPPSTEPSDARPDGDIDVLVRPCLDPRDYRMRRSSRIAVAVAALLLLAVYVAPLWRIELIAPQYPEGLGLRIWVNQITGLKPNDLNSINGLNHYIGMHAIEPDEIPELEFMPKLLAVAIGGRPARRADWPSGSALSLGGVVHRGRGGRAR